MLFSKGNNIYLFKLLRRRHEVRLNLFLKRVVREWLLLQRLLVQLKQRLKLLIRYDLAPIIRILEVVVANVSTDVLSYIDTRLQLIRTPTSELGHLTADRDRLHKSRRGILSTIRILALLLHSTRGILLELLERLVEGTKKANTTHTALIASRANSVDLILDLLLQRVKGSKNGLAINNTTLLGDLRCSCSSCRGGFLNYLLNYLLNGSLSDLLLAG